MTEDEELSEEEKKAMAEWEASASAPPSKELNQSEIDSLLGVSSVQSSVSKNKGVKALLDQSLQSYEKLPMLEIVFDRFVRICSTSLRNFTSETVEIDIESMTSLRFGSYIDSIPMPALIIIFKAIEWENFGLMTVDTSLIYSLVDILFGGRKINRPVKMDGRPYTTIEQGVARQLAEIILSDLSQAFDTITPTNLQFDRIETNPKFATIARSADAAVALKLDVQMEDRKGKIGILIPYSTIEPIKNLLLQVFMGDKFGKDIEWESHLENEVLASDIEIEAVLKNKTVTMKDVFNLKVGNTIIMEHSIEDDVLVHSHGIKMFIGKLGRIGNSIAIQVVDRINNDMQSEL